MTTIFSSWQTALLKTVCKLSVIKNMSSVFIEREGEGEGEEEGEGEGEGEGERERGEKKREKGMSKEGREGERKKKCK